MAKVKVCICPYCGETQPVGERCRACSGLFEPLSRQATHNAMGPWFIRDENRPFQPGCSYETLVELIEKGRISKYAIIRGPTTRQFWQVARRVPGIAHLLGYCPNCEAHVDPKDLNCPSCGAAFGAYLDRNHLGLPDVNPLPWDADEDESGSTAVFRQYFAGGGDGPPRPQATGLSSFAHDEEIVDADRGVGDRRSMISFRDIMGGPLVDDDSAPQRDTAGGAATATRQRAAAAVGEADAGPGSYAATARQRALERRLAQQRNLTRIFAILFFATVLFAIAVQFGWIGSRGGQTPSDNSPAAKTDTAREAEAGEEGRGEEGPVGGENQPGEAASDHETDATEETEAPDSPTDSSGTGAGETAQNTSDASGANDATNAPQRNPYLGEYDRAQELVRHARDDSQPLEARIRDLEEAIAVLENVQRNVPESRWPTPDLPDDIERYRDELDRLELRRFFDDA